MVPGPDGGLYVAIPAGDGSVGLALLGSDGRPRGGWPVVLAGATDCVLLLAAEDGSVRIVCAPNELNEDLNNGVRMYAFDSTGRELDGWPVDHDGFVLAGSTVRDALTVFTLLSAGDVIEEGQPSYLGAMVTVSAKGAMRSGSQLPIFDSIAPCCHRWAVGPDGIGYGMVLVNGSPDMSRITALGLSGVRAGWPVSFDGIASRPAFGHRERILVTVGSYTGETSRITVVERDGDAIAASSTALPIVTHAFQSDDGSNECGILSPLPPLVAQDGTTFVVSEIDTAIYALDSTLGVIRGWPYRPATPIVRRFDFPDELDCGTLATPAVGSDSTLYLPLQARTATVGASLVAVGSDGRVLAGWPVELKRPGAEFWSVAVGEDGTVYALAIEPEPNKTSSASILAIAPDSTVRYTATIVEP